MAKRPGEVSQSEGHSAEESSAGSSRRSFLKGFGLAAGGAAAARGVEFLADSKAAKEIKDKGSVENKLRAASHDWEVVNSFNRKGLSEFREFVKTFPAETADIHRHDLVSLGWWQRTLQDVLQSNRRLELIVSDVLGSKDLKQVESNFSSEERENFLSRLMEYKESMESFRKIAPELEAFEFTFIPTIENRNN